jgi:hypothetical protein
MRRKAVLSLGLLLAGPAVACANTRPYRATPPTHVLIVLKKAPVGGGCVSFTIPQRVAVRTGDAIAWEVVNAGCDGSPKVSLVFPRLLVEFKNFDSYPGQDSPAAPRKAPASGERPAAGTPTESEAFASRGAGTVVGPKGSFKYKVRLSTGYLEDPDLDIWP